MTAAARQRGVEPQLVIQAQPSAAGAPAARSPRRQAGRLPLFRRSRWARRSSMLSNTGVRVPPPSPVPTPTPAHSSRAWARSCRPSRNYVTFHMNNSVGRLAAGQFSGPFNGGAMDFIVPVCRPVCRTYYRSIGPAQRRNDRQSTPPCPAASRLENSDTITSCSPIPPASPRHEQVGVPEPTNTSRNSPLTESAPSGMTIAPLSCGPMLVVQVAWSQYLTKRASLVANLLESTRWTKCPSPAHSSTCTSGSR